VYTAGKCAVDSVTRVLAKELSAKKIQVNSIKPGVVETEGTHSAGVIGSDLQKLAESISLLGPTGQANNIAPVAVFLASDDSRCLTGELLLTSGGIRQGAILRSRRKSIWARIHRSHIIAAKTA
jgi:3-oxoacyl-[acyl-carrier protein] reductase